MRVVMFSFMRVLTLSFMRILMLISVLICSARAGTSERNWTASDGDPMDDQSCDMDWCEYYNGQAENQCEAAWWVADNVPGYWCWYLFTPSDCQQDASGCIVQSGTHSCPLQCFPDNPSTSTVYELGETMFCSQVCSNCCGW